MSGSSEGKTPEEQDEYPDADRRRDEALKRALNMPPKPHKGEPDDTLQRDHPHPFKGTSRKRKG